MFDEKLYERILALECTEKELNSISPRLAEMEYDSLEPFDKYYSLDRVRACIQKLDAGEWSVMAAAGWVNVYNWIVMGGFKGEDHDEDKKEISLAALIRYEISDWLDGMSFMDGVYSPPAEFYLEGLTRLDGFYKDRNDWDGFYTFTDNRNSDGGEMDDIYLLLINGKRRQIIISRNDSVDWIRNKPMLTLVALKEFKGKIKEYNTLGYKELPHFFGSEYEE